MNLGTLKQELAAQNVILSVAVSGKLKYKAAEPLPVVLIDAMREHKKELLFGAKKHPKKAKI